MCESGLRTKNKDKVLKAVFCTLNSCHAGFLFQS